MELKEPKVAIYFLILILMVSLYSGCGKSSDRDVSSPQGAIDFSLPDIEGNIVNFSDYRGKVVIVDFWATWCGPCISEIPHFIDLQNTYQLEGLQIIGVTMQSGSSEDVAEKVRELNINYTIVMGNNEVAQKFGGVRAFPTTFVMDKEGKIYKKYIGALPNIKELFEADIKALF